MIVLLGFAGLVTDAGLLYTERRHLQNAADAAALAGAQVFLREDWTEEDLVDGVYQWAVYNGVLESEVTEISLGTKSLPIGDLPTVTVRVERPVKLMFTPIFGISERQVGVRAVAGVTPMQPLNIWPWAITESTYQQLLEQQSSGQEVYLKVSSQDNKSGNFLPLALGGTSGAAAYKSNIINGYDDRLPVQVPPGPWIVPTETGNMSGPTEEGVSYLLEQPACSIPGNDIRCPLIGLIPVMTDESWTETKGRSVDVSIVNLPVFRVTRLAQEPGAPGGGKGHQVVFGRFLEQGTAVGPTNPNSTIELFGIRLWD